MNITKAIIPVAGYGTRFLPVTKALPKEMLPVVDKPIIQYIVEEAVEAGITDIIFVTGRGKRAIEDHFDVSFELERTLVEREKKALLEQVAHLHTLARFSYVRQAMPKGNGDAILRARHLIDKDEPVAVMFGDDIVDAKTPALRQLIDVYEHYHDPVIATVPVSAKEIVRYGNVEGRRAAKDNHVVEVSKITEKPKRPSARKTYHAAVGRYIVTPELLETLTAVQKKADAERKKKIVKEEVGISDALAAYLTIPRPVYGVVLEGARYDCGNKAGYLKANLAYAMKRPELKEEMQAFLKKL